MPDVSVLTPSRGYGRYIRDAIQSVLGQRDLSVEHVVQDGGSDDETVAILNSSMKSCEVPSRIGVSPMRVIVDVFLGLHPLEDPNRFARR